MTGREANAISVAFDDGLRGASVARAAILAPVLQILRDACAQNRNYNVIKKKKKILITVLLLSEYTILTDG